MPIYEYRCGQCRRKFSVFWRTLSEVDEAQVRCRYCGSQEAQRLISRVRVLRAADSGGEDFDPGDFGDFDENDPKSLGRFMRKMMNEVGDEAGELGPEFEEVVDRLEAGQSPEDIEQSMPDLLGAAGPGDAVPGSPGPELGDLGGAPDL